MLPYILILLKSYAGTFSILDHQSLPSIGHLSVTADISQLASLSIEDDPGNGGNLVSSSGIHFGEVNNLGTTTQPGIQATRIGNIGHYEAKFILNIQKSGVGKMNVRVRRLMGGFNSNNGVEMDDYLGQLRSIPLHQDGLLTLNNVSSGSHSKTLAINILPTDSGTLKSVLQFTLSCF